MTPFCRVVNLLMMITIFNFFYCVEGIECYLCVYVSDGLGAADIGLTAQEFDEFYDESCSNGRVPESKFIETCYDGLACRKRITEGFSQFDNSPIKIVVRGCSMTFADKSECRSLTFEDLTKDPGVPTTLISKISSKARTRHCTCTTDACNKSSNIPVTSVWCIFFVIFLMHGIIITVVE